MDHENHGCGDHNDYENHDYGDDRCGDENRGHCFSYAQLHPSILIQKNPFLFPLTHEQPKRFPTMLE